MNAFQLIVLVLVMVVMVVFCVDFFYRRWTAPCPECDAEQKKNIGREFDPADLEDDARPDPPSGTPKAKQGSPRVKEVESDSESDISESSGESSDSDISDDD